MRRSSSRPSGLSEAKIEEFIRKNIRLIFDQEEDDETLLIVGQQVVNLKGARNDLVALDGNGNLVLIEIKRDAADMTSRIEAMEFQAVRLRCKPCDDCYRGRPSRTRFFPLHKEME